MTTRPFYRWISAARSRPGADKLSDFQAKTVVAASKTARDFKRHFGSPKTLVVSISYKRRPLPTGRDPEARFRPFSRTGVAGSHL